LTTGNSAAKVSATAVSVEILSHGDSPDRIALIDGIETALELTAAKAGSAGDVVTAVLRLAGRKMRAMSDARC